MTLHAPSPFPIPFVPPLAVHTQDDLLDWLRDLINDQADVRIEAAGVLSLGREYPSWTDADFAPLRLRFYHRGLDVPQSFTGDVERDGVSVGYKAKLTVVVDGVAEYEI